MMRARTLAACGAIVLAGAGPPGARAAPAVRTIVIEGMLFLPPLAEARVGDVIVWRNKDPFPHTVASAGPGFASPPIPPQGSWRFKAKRAGTHAYVCTLHPTMKGVLRVR